MSRQEEKQLKLNNVRLGDVLENTITGEWGAECTSSNGVRVLRTTNFTNTGELSFENVVERQIDAKKVAKKKLCPGDLIVEKSGGTKDNPVGRVVHFDNPDGVYLCNNFTQILRPLKSVHSRFLFYTLYFYYRTNKSEGLYNKTTGIQNLQMSRYLDLKFSFPPLAEQKRIAEELDNICAAKKDAEAIVEKLKLLAKSLFVEMFGEQESAKYPLLEIGSLFKVGGPKRIHQREWTEEGVPFLRVSDVVSKIKGDISLPAMYISNDRYAELKEAGAVPSAGDILVTARGTLGECYIVKADDAFYFQDGMITWLSAMDGRLDVTYIVNAMRQDGFRRQFLGKEVGSTVAYLSISQLAKLKVIVPPLPLQRQFAAFIEQLDKSQFEAQALIGKLDLLYRAKLQEYFG